MAEATAARQPQQTAADVPDPRRWLALAIVLTGSFMVNLDTTIVNVAIPAIERSLSASYAQIEWVLSGYQLAYGALLITGGRLGDLFGRKRLFIAGMIVFTVASVTCGIAPTPELLILSRVIQGAGAAMLYPQILSTIQVSFSGRERGTAFGTVGATIGIATVLGPLAGGVLIALDIAGLDWRPVFLVNLPVGILSLFAAGRYMRETRSPLAARLDLGGVALVSIGLVMFTLPLVEGRDAGWPLWTLCSLVGSFAVLGGFLAWERRRSSRGESTLVHFALFRDRPFVIGLVMSLVYFAGFTSVFFTLSLYLQIGLGFDPLATGLAIVPFAAGSFVGSALSSKAQARLGRTVILIGSALVIVGLSGLIVTIHLVGDTLAGIDLAPTLLIGGLGSGLVIAPLIGVILGNVDPHQAGAASGVLNTGQRVGAAIGVAIIGIAFFSLIGSTADSATTAVEPQLRASLASSLPAGAIDGAVAQFKVCFHDRANETDPTAIPPSCPPSDSSPASVAFASAATSAERQVFTDAMQLATVANVLAVVATFLLAFALPRRRRAESEPPRAVAVDV